MIYFYRTIWIILGPIIDIWFLWRLITGKEDRKRFKERMGLPSIKRPEGQLIWIHGSSVGETLSILPLVNKLLADNNGVKEGSCEKQGERLSILVTSGTKTSAKLMAEKLPEGAFHQYVPLDFVLCVSYFLNHWKPDMSVFVESEFWPEMMHQAPNKVLVNARISDRSYKKYSKYKWLINWLLKDFKLLLAQSPQDAERLKNLADKNYWWTKNIKMSGNLKFDAEPSKFDVAELKSFQKQTSNRPILLCVSTHDPEEIWLANIHSKLKKVIPDLLTIIAPRHPNRGTKIVEQIEKFGKVTQRSKNERLNNGTDFYIADTIGEMQLWFNLAQKNGVVVMGGSLIPHGGQNPLEALKAGCPVICGPNMQNFKNMLDDLLKDKAIQQTVDIDDLTEKLEVILTNKATRDEFIKPIGYAMEKLTGATDYTAEKIRGLL